MPHLRTLPVAARTRSATQLRRLQQRLVCGLVGMLCAAAPLAPPMLAQAQSFPVHQQSQPTRKPGTHTAAKPKAQPPAKPVVAAAPAPTQVPGFLNRQTIVLDPAHGGVDNGARIGDSVLEKDVTLALALRLRSLLTARGFTVVMTRQSDLPTAQAAPGQPTGGPLSLDDRAGAANHAHAVACLLLHATGAGQGVHLYRSQLAPAAVQPAVVPWLTAQAAWVGQSVRLQAELAAAISRSEMPLVSSAASVRPIDSLSCPAVVVELAPPADEPEAVADPDYQQRVALAVAGALVFWSKEAQPPPSGVQPHAAAAPADSATPTASAPGGQP